MGLRVMAFKGRKADDLYSIVLLQNFATKLTLSGADNGVSS
jgi:hypothetical protein